jgi:hypothetical protein
MWTRQSQRACGLRGKKKIINKKKAGFLFTQSLALFVFPLPLANQTSVAGSSGWGKKLGSWLEW